MVDIDVITTLIVGFVKVACTLLSMVGKQHLCPEYIGTRANAEAAASSIHPFRMRWNSSSKPFFEDKFNEFPSFKFNFSKFRFNFSEPDFSIESIDFDSFFNCDKSSEEEGSADGAEVEEFARVERGRLTARLSDAIDKTKLTRVLERASQLLDNPIKWNKPLSIDYEIPAKFKSQGTINELSLGNASKYKVNSVDVDDMDLTVKLGLDSLLINGKYDMDLEMFDPDSKLSGKGPFNIDLENVDVLMKMSLEENDDREVSLKDFKFDLKPAAVKVNLTGLSGDGKSEAELNEMMREKILSRLEMLHSDPEVASAVRKVAQQYWQLLFDGATVHQINSFMDAITVA